MAATDRRTASLEALAVVADFDRPAALVPGHADPDVAWLGVLADILQCFLDDAQGDDLDRLRQRVDALVKIDVDGNVQRGRDLVGGLADRTAEPGGPPGGAGAAG